MHARSEAACQWGSDAFDATCTGTQLALLDATPPAPKPLSARAAWKALQKCWADARPRLRGAHARLLADARELCGRWILARALVPDNVAPKAWALWTNGRGPVGVPELLSEALAGTGLHW